MLSDGTIAGGMIANTKYQICHEVVPMAVMLDVEHQTHLYGREH